MTSTESVGSTREEAERLVAAGLGAVSTALQGMAARRHLSTLAEQMLDPDQLQDLAAGLNGFVAGASPGAAGHGSTAFSTGSADCCVCPVCRVIAALRDPSPEFAEQMASAVGDLAVGLTGLLRAFSSVMSTPREPGVRSTPGEAGARSAPREPEGDSEILEDLASHTRSDSPRSGRPGARKSMAKKAVKKAARRDTGK
jgi:hypothetical protein